ncbi:MAG: signal peptidase I [Clostridia bacterium]
MIIKMDPKLKNILEWAYCIIIAVGLALLVRYYLGTPTIVQQTSMVSTLQPGERLILSRITRTTKGEYQRGDIITFEAPSSIKNLDYDNPVAIYEYEPKGWFSKFVYKVLEIGKTSYIKRIIGMPGDHILIQDGKVFLNGEELEEPYLAEGVKTYSNDYTDITVPEGYVFAMGDNREYSKDCRSLGCIPIDKIESKVWIRFWPLTKFGKVE